MNRPLVALLLALSAGGIAAAPVRALLPAYVESVLHLPPSFTATLLAIQLGCGGLFALVGGALSDLVSRRAAVLVGLTTALFGAGLFAVHHPAALVAIAVLWGLATGFHSAGGQSFLMAAVSRARLGSATAAYFVSTTASGAVGAYLAGAAADRWGFGTVAAGAAALGVCALALTARFLPDMGRDAPGGAAGRGGRTGRWLSGYSDLLRDPNVQTLCVLRYFPTVAWGAASLAIPLLVFRLSGTAGSVGLYSMVSLLAASAAQMATGGEIDRRTKAAARRAETGAAPSGARGLVPWLSVAILISAVACALVNGSIVGLFAAGIAWAMSAWALSTTMPPLIHEIGAGRDDGRLVALTHMVWSAGMLTGSFVAGALVDFDAAAPFWAAAACLVITVGAGIRFARGASVAPLGSPPAAVVTSAVGQMHGVRSAPADAARPTR